MPELATKVNQLFNEMNRLRLISKVDKFTLIRLEREAQKLLSVNAFYAYQFLGMLAGFKENIFDIHENYKRALKLATTTQDRAIALNNYAASLYNMGYFLDAVTLSIEAYTDNPPIEVIETINDRFLYAGLFHQAANFAREYNLASNDFIFAIAVEQFMDKHGITDKQLQKLIEIGISILHKHQFFNFRNSTKFEFTEDEYSKWLCLIIKVDRSVDEIVEMKYELACALAESDLPTELLLNFIVAYEIAGE